MVEIMMQFFLLVLATLGGIMWGKALYSKKNQIDGDFYINNTDDPEYAACGISFNKGAETLMKRETVTLRVHLNSPK